MWHCTILLLCITGSLFGQGELRISHHYTKQDGLSHTECYAIHEDSRGFLWIATAEGLNRFDGFRFRTWYHSKRDTGTLAHNAVNDILEYREGMLLLATPNGLSVFNTHTGAFENHLIEHNELKPGNGANVTSLYMHTDSTIWVNQNGEFDLLDKSLRYISRMTSEPWAKGLRGSTVLYEKWQPDDQERLWLPTDTSGLQVVDLKQKVVYNRYHNPHRWPFMDFRLIRAFYMDKERQVMYLAPWGSGLYRYNLRTNEVIHQDFSLPLVESSSINAIVKLENGKLLCSAGGVFFEVDPVSLDFSQIDVMGQRAAGQLHRPIRVITMLQSTGYKYWVGAYEGLYLLETNRQQWELALDAIPAGTSCLDNLIGSDRLIYTLYDNYTLVVTDGIRKMAKYYTVPHNPGDFLTQMAEDDQRRIWIGTSRGVQLFDMKGGGFPVVPHHAGALSRYFVHTIFHDSKGTTWIATRQPFGLYRLDHQRGETHNIDNEPLRIMGTVSDHARISSIHEDKHGSLWFRSIVGGGILQYNRTDDTWHHHPDGNVPLLSNSGLNALYPDNTGTLWFSTTVGDGLVSYDARTGTIEQYNLEDGLLSDYIMQMEHYRGRLFLTTQYGYSAFDMHTHSIVSTDWYQEPGDFEMAIDTPRGWMVLGTSGKLLFAALDDVAQPSGSPVPLIDGIFVNNEPRYIDAKKTRLRLAFDQRNIAIAFTSAYFDEADKLDFAYRLVGADDGWQPARESRIAQYAALPPGTYVFQLKVADPRGHWSEVTDALTFTIVPPFWQQPWFVGLVLLTIGTIVYLVLQRRFTSLQYASGLRQKIAETEMMALRAQMNPHFIFNSINSIDALIMNDDKYQATMYLNKFAKLIRNILDSSRQNTVPIEKDIETLQLYIELEQLRSENAFTSEINIDPELLEKDIRVPPLIIQPYVENAILHGLKHRRDDMGKLLIAVAKAPQGIAYAIEDNGVGREAHVNGNKNGKVSYGMQISSDRIRMFNQEEKADVRITDLHSAGKPAGTKVEINLKTA